MSKLAVVRQAKEPPAPRVNPDAQQAIAGQETVNRSPGEFMHMPWRSLDDVWGGMSRGEVHFVCAHRGNGKTLFVTNLEREWLNRDVGVYHIPLETRPKLVRLQMACLNLGVYYGAVVSGEAAETWSDWETVKQELIWQFQWQRIHWGDYWHINDAPSLNERGLRDAMREAHAMGMQVVVIDHIDHLDVPDGSNEFQTSKRVTRALNEDAQEFGITVIALSQLNGQATAGSRLAVYAPPQPNAVYMGGHKAQVATTMWGLYRPLRADARVDELKAVREGMAEPKTVIEPDVMAISNMKHRHYGAREGTRVLLGVQRGKLVELSEVDHMAITNGRPGGRYG